MKKNKLCSLIFSVLAKGIASLYQKDKEIKYEINSLPDTFCITLGILPFGTYIYLLKKDNKIYVSKYKFVCKYNLDGTKQFYAPNLAVFFKNSTSAKKVMLAKESVSDSFCKHNILLSGDIAQALVLVRVINKTECYLFPHFMTKAILPKIAKQCCSLSIYGKILFGKYKYKPKLE